MPSLTGITLLSRIGGLLLFAIGGVVLGVLSVQGYGNALRNTSDLQTLAQYVMTGSQFLYSALGPCVIVLRFVSSAWFRAAWQAWALFFTAAVGLIPSAWIEPSILSTLGFTAVGVACAASICFLVTRGAVPSFRRRAAGVAS
jgi:hypothetical protein